MLSRCFLDVYVGVRAFVIGLSQISSFFSFTKTRKSLMLYKRYESTITLRNVYGVGSPTVGSTSSSVRLHIYVPSHILLKYRRL